MLSSNKGPPRRSGLPATSWEPVARWYRGWAGPDGSYHHRELAIPAALSLLELRPGEQLLDLGAGPGVLAPFVSQAGAGYTGVDLSGTLIRTARRVHGAHGRFLVGDARALSRLPRVRAGAFDVAVFLLSIQDMEPLDAVLASAAWSVRPGGRVVLLMTHPCFRVPRQSGWGHDERRNLHYRRVDRYLTPLAVPMKRYGQERNDATRSFHRPLETYINELSANGLVVDQLREIPLIQSSPSSAPPRAIEHLNPDIPLFLGLRARKLATANAGSDP
jgi:SAM-dependent methyltransferase